MVYVKSLWQFLGWLFGDEYGLPSKLENIFLLIWSTMCTKTFLLVLRLHSQQSCYFGFIQSQYPSCYPCKKGRNPIVMKPILTNLVIYWKLLSSMIIFTFWTLLSSPFTQVLLPHPSPHPPNPAWRPGNNFMLPFWNMVLYLKNLF
jgi:hypothetical protein